MPEKKRTFFDRLTGAVNMEPHEEEKLLPPGHPTTPHPDDEYSEVGQLSVDVYETGEAIFIKAMVAGVKPEDVDVSISRDSVTIRGRRAEDHTVADNDYTLKELYWGEFARTVTLHSEIEPDEAEANYKHGLLVIRLPKIDKNRKTKLRVRTV